MENNQKKTTKNPVTAVVTGFLLGTPEGTRTPNIQNRNLTLYPLNYGRVFIKYLIIITERTRKVK